MELPCVARAVTTGRLAGGSQAQAHALGWRLYTGLCYGRHNARTRRGALTAELELRSAIPDSRFPIVGVVLYL
jgi:hypothetical protein